MTTRSPVAPLLVAALLTTVVLVSPASALDQAIYSGDKPMDPINIVSAKVNGVATTAKDTIATAPTLLEFTLTNNPKSLTFNGVNHGLTAADTVMVSGFKGQYSITNGNIKFSGTAADWAICNRDPDADGLNTCEEKFTYRTDPNKFDTDGDGLGDGAEVRTHGTDPLRADTDGDGLSDGAEVNTYGTNPKNRDTDGDGLSDGAEVNTHGTDPKRADTDGDGLSDGAEVNTHGTDPKRADTDADGLGDGAEVNTHGTDPKDADTDGDCLTDGAEVNTHHTDPLSTDSDGDGLTDCEEVNVYHSSPTNPDTDGGGVPDGTEIARGSDPLDPTDDHYATSWTESGPQGARFVWIDVDVVKVGDAYASGPATYDGAVGNLTFNAKYEGGQWVTLNDTDVELSTFDFVELTDFRGKVEVRVLANGSMQLRYDGVAARMVFFDEGNRMKLTHTQGNIRSDEAGNVYVDLKHAIADQAPITQSAFFPMAVPPNTPLYSQFDVWKDDEVPSGPSSWRITMEPATINGQEVLMVRIYNPDPVLINQPIPVAGSPVKTLCIQAPEQPTKCG